MVLWHVTTNSVLVECLYVYSQIIIDAPRASGTIVSQEPSIPGVGLFLPQSESHSSAIFYLHRWNMPWEFCVRQMNGGSDQTAPWFHLSSHIYTFCQIWERSLSQKGVFVTFFSRNSILYLSVLLLKHFKWFSTETTIKVVFPLAYMPISLGF